MIIFPILCNEQVLCDEQVREQYCCYEKIQHRVSDWEVTMAAQGAIAGKTKEIKRLRHRQSNCFLLNPIFPTFIAFIINISWQFLS